MNILVTGASGFVGSHMLKLLQNEPDLNVSCISRKKIKGFNTIRCNDYRLDGVVFDDCFDVLVLLGAVTPKGFGNETFSNYMTNIISIDALLHKIGGVPQKIIFASSVSVYNHELMISEETSLNIDDSYGLSKIVCEQMLKDYCRKNGTKLLIARLGNIYGPGEEKYNKIIGGFIKKALANEPITLRSQGNEFRNLIYVGDVCRYLYNAILADIHSFFLVNCVSRTHHTIRDIAKAVVKAVGNNNKILFGNSVDVRIDTFDSALFYDIWLKDNPEITLEQGINYTVVSFVNSIYSRK